MTLAPDLRSRALRLALENALEHRTNPRAESILGALLGSDPSLRQERERLVPLVREVVAEVSSMSLGAREERLQSLGGPEPRPARPPRSTSDDSTPQDLPDLPGAEKGRVTLRFAPFPSGALHVGHARAIFLNDTYRERYDGKFLLVFDDTVGSAEKRPSLESYDLILEDFELAGVKVSKIYYKSDRLPEYYRHLPPLLRSGTAYVCLCPAEDLRRRREAGEPCPERDRDAAWQSEAWEGMLAGRYGEGEAVVRLKTDLHHPNPAFRDRVLFRISHLDHPRVGHRYRVWPLLEFSWAVDDVDLGITHVLRGKDLVMEDEMEEALWRAWGWTGPRFTHFGLLRIREAKLSKSKFQREIASGVFEGWADPRTWSLRSLWRRGIRPEAVKQFVLSFGLSLADIEVPAETLYAVNRHLLDPTTPRRSFVPDPVPVQVLGDPLGPRTVSLANHPEHPEMGERTLRVTDRFYLPGRDVADHLGEEVRLKDLLNLRLPRTAGPGTLQAEFTGQPNKPLPRLQWVPVEDAVPVSVLGVDHQSTEGFGEGNLARAPEGSVLQFERFGFVRADAPPTSPDAPRRFFFAHR
jgi:glutamyl-tRNA synthetase